MEIVPHFTILVGLSEQLQLNWPPYSGGPPNLTVTSLEQFWVAASHTL